jgi:hypothetical protein
MFAEGKIKREVAERLLEGAAKINGLWREDGAEAVRATIRSGIETGIESWNAMVGDGDSDDGDRAGDPYMQPFRAKTEMKLKRRRAG